MIIRVANTLAREISETISPPNPRALQTMNESINSLGLVPQGF
jgi:hypothetical protein